MISDHKIIIRFFNYIADVKMLEVISVLCFKQLIKIYYIRKKSEFRALIRLILDQIKLNQLEKKIKITSIRFNFILEKKLALQIEIQTNKMLS